jgi:hypothetical protein
MNKKPDADFSAAQTPVRRGLCVAVTAILLASVGAVFIHFKQSSSEPMQQRAEGEAQRTEVEGQRSEVRDQRSDVNSDGSLPSTV